MKTMEAATINERNIEFWAGRQKLMEESLNTPFLFDHAFGKVAVDVVVGKPTRDQMCFEAALFWSAAEIGQFKEQARIDQGKLGGRPASRDALDTLILCILEQLPDIKTHKLRFELKKRKEVIQKIEGGLILFAETDGSIKTAKLSGLKDRLYRLRKKISSQ